jgi:hypothetical protein
MKLVSVDIKRGNHATPLPPRTQQFVEEELMRRGLVGRFTLMWGPRILGTKHSPSFKAKRICPEKGNIEMIIKPGGNATAHTAWIAPGNGVGHGDNFSGGEMSLEQLADRLLQDPPTPDVSKPAPAVAHFSDSERNVTAFLRVLAGSEPITNRADVERFYDELDILLGERGARGWGNVIPAIKRRGLIEYQQERTNSNVIAINLTEKGRERVGKLQPLRAQKLLAPHESVEPALAAEAVQVMSDAKSMIPVSPNNGDWDAMLRQRLLKLEEEESNAISRVIELDDQLVAVRQQLEELKKQEHELSMKKDSAELDAERAENKLAAARLLLEEDEK